MLETNDEAERKNSKEKNQELEQEVEQEVGRGKRKRRNGKQVEVDQEKGKRRNGSIVTTKNPGKRLNGLARREMKKKRSLKVWRKIYQNLHGLVTLRRRRKRRRIKVLFNHTLTIQTLTLITRTYPLAP